ncbi:MAG: exodeoxyribonuclease VII small subunit [Prevotellaceae bacterium]|jgi:exodeoxyribonuclease VII small subunit|nr:exodeoxyribonuclease VII small subunit [Prevotellaceae bacterium]
MNKNQKYKDALNEIESIIATMENGEPDIDDTLKNVKRASELIKFCKEKLRTVDEELTKLMVEN